MLIYNFLFMIISWLIIGLGIYAEIMRSEFTSFEHFLMTPSIILLLCGSIILFFAFIGFLAALRDNLFLMKVFTICSIICIIIEISGGVLAFLFRSESKNFINRHVINGLKTYYDDPDLKDFVDLVQKEFKCCGGVFYKDWIHNRYHSCSAPGPSACGVPYSCCRESHNPVLNSMCGYDTISMKINEAVEHIYVQGCIDGVVDYLWTNLDVFGAVLLGILLPQIIGIILCVSYKEVVIMAVTSILQSNKSNQSISKKSLLSNKLSA